MNLRILAVWAILAGLAIGNGAMREILLVPSMGALNAHWLSTTLLVLLILAVSFVSMTLLGVRRASEAWCIGTSWLVLTLAFEFLAGHYVFGTPWSKILADYNLLAGRVWILAPLAIFLGPWLALSVRRNVQNGP